MHKKLLLESFEKAEEKLGTDRITHLSQELSDFIVESSNQPYGEKTLRVSFNKVKNNPEEKLHLKQFAADGLSQYLGYENFSEYVKSNSEPTLISQNKPSKLKRLNKIIIISTIIIVVSIISHQSFTKQRWMVWNNNHYVEINFDAEKYNLNEIKLYNEDRITNFRKINPDCSYEFFNSDGSVNVWYGKNNNKDYEFFTSLGKHPETGKTLKEITTYIRDKYICN